MLDSGNLLFKRLTKGSESEEERRTAETIVRIYEVLKYDAVAVGPLDLTYGTSFLKSASNTFPWLSANLYDESGNRLFKPFITVVKNDLRCGIIGISDTLSGTYDHIKASSWEDELGSLVPEVSSSHDITILLTTVSNKTAETIAKRHPDIDIIIGADRRKGNREGTLINQSVLTQTASQGKYLGVMSVLWRFQPWAVDYSRTMAALQRQLDSSNRQLARLRRQQRADSQKDVLDQIQSVEARITTLKEKFTTVESKMDAERVGGETRSIFATKFLPLKHTMPGDPEIRSIITSAQNQRGLEMK